MARGIACFVQSLAEGVAGGNESTAIGLVRLMQRSQIRTDSSNFEDYRCVPINAVLGFKLGMNLGWVDARGRKQEFSFLEPYTHHLREKNQFDQTA